MERQILSRKYNPNSVRLSSFEHWEHKGIISTIWVNDNPDDLRVYGVIEDPRFEKELNEYQRVLNIALNQARVLSFA